MNIFFSPYILVQYLSSLLPEASSISTLVLFHPNCYSAIKKGQCSPLFFTLCGTFIFFLSFLIWKAMDVWHNIKAAWSEAIFPSAFWGFALRSVMKQKCRFECIHTNDSLAVIIYVLHIASFFDKLDSPAVSFSLCSSTKNILTCLVHKGHHSAFNLFINNSGVTTQVKQCKVHTNIFYLSKDWKQIDLIDGLEMFLICHYSTELWILKFIFL